MQSSQKKKIVLTLLLGQRLDYDAKWFKNNLKNSLEFCGKVYIGINILAIFFFNESDNSDCILVACDGWVLTKFSEVQFIVTI